MTSKNKNSRDPAYETDIVIIGSGLAGLSLAALLGKAGFSVICIDRDSPEARQDKDLRTTAISYGSSTILEKAGIWERLAGKGCPIRDIRILDGPGSPVYLNFLSSDVEDKSFGWIFTNSDLRKAALDAASEYDNVTFMAPARASDFETTAEHAIVMLENGDRIAARLLVGADGRFSAVRDWMDAPLREWHYNQRAITAMITHENPHENIAVEHFWPGGPLAVLPAPDGPDGRYRSSIVLTEDMRPDTSLMDLDDDLFVALLQERMPEFYGTIKLDAPRQAYPLNLRHAARYAGARCVLVADAAHAIHPVAGQGLNLGLRDVDALADILSGQDIAADPGTPEALRGYERRRRPDNVSMVAVTDGLVRLFSNDNAPLRLLRAAGLKAVQKIKPVKRFFMRQAMADRNPALDVDKSSR